MQKPENMASRMSDRCAKTVLRGGASLLLLACALPRADAQNLHFSQFFHSPLTANAANTGFIPEADYRIGANYRSQWASIPVPYRTMGVWGDAQVFRDRFETGWVGLGGAILRDVAGTGNLSSTKAYASAAYHQMLGVTGLLSAGFSVGFVNKRVDVSRFTYDNQWNGKFFDRTILNGESFLNTSIGYLDVQAGLNYAWFPTDDIYLHGGLSVMQLNRPRETFFSPNPSYNANLDARYTVFADAMVKLNDRWILSPGGYYQQQSAASELTAGLHLDHNLSGNGEHQLSLGVYYRTGDAVIPVVGYTWRNIRFMFSYDATVSTLGDYINRQGATEFALMQSGFYREFTAGMRQSLCPRF
jgi:type IX secretion system PorP/SprF family membrane protein